MIKSNRKKTRTRISKLSAFRYTLALMYLDSTFGSHTKENTASHIPHKVNEHFNCNGGKQKLSDS